MKAGITETLARRAAAHPRLTLAVWAVVVLVSIGLIATQLHGLTTTSTVSGKPSSAKAADLFARGFPSPSASHAVSDVVVVHSGRYMVDAPPYRAFVARLIASIRATGGIVTARSYLTGNAPVSSDRHATLVELLISSDDDAKPVVKAVQKSGGGTFTAAITGDHSVANDFNTLSQRDLEHGELEFGLPAALVVLILVFASIVGGLVPLLMAILSIVVGLGLIAMLSLEFSLSIFIVNMLIGMGLALGIDYSLFVVSRYGEERNRGLLTEAAISRAGATASRAVLFSGSTFVVALFGMLIVPTSIMRSLAAGAIIVGIVSVAAALTLLPALLALFGDRVNSLPVPYLGRNLERGDAAEGRVWRRIVDAVLRRPVLSLTLSAGAMIALAVPTVFVVAQAGGASTPRRFAVLKRDLAGSPHFGPATVSQGRDGIVALRAPVVGDAVGGAAVTAVRDLKHRRIPAAFAGSTARVYVGGKTAEAAEYYDAVTNPTPYVLAFVLGLSFILLTVAFRSIVVAAVSILLNLLSVGAAYGLLTLVFLDGHGASFFGFEHVPVIDAWVPLFLFSVLFALSMDYQVFLMSRIRERYDQTGSTREAVASGVASTARIITGAALIIVVVFAGFARGRLVMFQQMGFGVAVALLLDATVIRSIVLPSMMSLIGDRAWYLPRWLDWLPHVEVERHAPEGLPDTSPA
jgi:uncharacterized membrane protein YdfJ with MMPL/SSD domain